ncbi:DUF1285 domain-containing protein [Breoghania sp.]|uniref:DUF1285 domain-containing protein n=1 Tax=Breoghania sp. TaxID=2065378 RepID=UPI0026186E89|nr:DUF1285 domain-containing protein [Breoghania sp.]MDJ0931586.1 DUF1285 domain-containing protein [Breoghania sp.]
MPHHIDVTPNALQELIRRAAPSGRGLPLVERWEPDYCGAIDMRIAADGSWHYMGTPINREALVRLFSTVLRHDADGEFYLVTPVEKIRITVEDAPFLAVEMHAQGEGRDQVLTFRTNVGDVVECDSDHPIRFAEEADTGGLKPYILVRGRLEAKLTRPLLYELAELVVEEREGERTRFGVWSGGHFFEMHVNG